MSKIKLSIIIAVYQSYEIVRRMMLWFDSLDLPDDIEIIIVDDGSEPILEFDHQTKNATLHRTFDKRPWTQGLARNAGARLAKGEYLLMTDIDHILSKEAIMDSYIFKGDKMIFPRFYGVLTEDGSFTQSEAILDDYGAILGTKRGLYVSYHGNTFCIKKETFEKLGMYDESACLYGHHATSKQGEDSYFNKKWNRYARENNLQPVVGSAIYLFPVGRYNKNYDLNPKGLFHNLSYEPVKQPNKK